MRAIGIGSFGPVDLNPASRTWGFITSTPKAGWQNTDLAGPLARALSVPVGFDTDVNAAALGEKRWGAAQDCSDFIYLTVGTGIGGGAMINDRLVHGVMHPEMGHTRVPHDLARDPFAGVCPFHGDCLEGLASGPAIRVRWNSAGQDLSDEHDAWQLEAHYLALGLANWVCALSPQRIVIGGGVLDRAHLFPLIRAELQRLLNDYIQVPELLSGIDQFIVPPLLGNSAGLAGTLVLAAQAAGDL